MLKFRLIIALVIALFLLTATLNNGESIRGTATAQHQTTQEPTEQPMTLPFRVKYTLGDFLYPEPQLNVTHTFEDFAADIHGGFLWIFGEAASSPEGSHSTFNNRIEVQKFHLGGGNAIERIQLGTGQVGGVVDGAVTDQGFIVVSNSSDIFYNRYVDIWIYDTSGNSVPILVGSGSQLFTFTPELRIGTGGSRDLFIPNSGETIPITNPYAIGVAGFNISDRMQTVGLNQNRIYNFSANLLLAVGSQVVAGRLFISWTYVGANRVYTSLRRGIDQRVLLTALDTEGNRVNIGPGNTRGWTGGKSRFTTLSPNEGTSPNFRARAVLNYNSSVGFVDAQLLSDVPAGSDLEGLGIEVVAGSGRNQERLMVYQHNETMKEVYYYGVAGTEPPPPPNADPVFTISQSVIELPVNTGANAVIGNYLASDPNGNTITFTLTGADAARFRIDNEGTLRTAQILDTRATYNINVVASDGRTPTPGTVMVSVQIIVGSGLPSDGVLPFRAKYAYNRPTNFLEGRRADAAHQFYHIAVSLYDNHVWVFGEIDVITTQEGFIRRDIVVWKYPLTGGSRLQEIILRGARRLGYEDAIAVEDGFVLLADNDSSSVVLEFYDTAGAPVTLRNDEGATIGNDIVIASAGQADMTIDNGDSQTVKIEGPQAQGIAAASFAVPPGIISGAADTRVVRVELLLVHRGASFGQRRMVACNVTLRPPYTRRNDEGRTFNISALSSISGRLVLVGNGNVVLPPRFFRDWTLTDAGNFGTYHMIFKDEVDRGQNINIVPPRARVIVHFSRQRALLGSQRLTEIAEGDSVAFVDGDLVNIAAEGESENNQTRLLVVDLDNRGTNPAEATRKTGDFLYYGGDSIPIGPHEVTSAIEGELAAEDVNRDGAVTVADLILVAALFGQQVPPNTAEDINGDGTVNMADLLAVAQAISPAAPSAAAHIDAATIEAWIAQARLEDDGSLAFKRGIENLLALLRSLIPEETALLRNYPNPFNPETWIPYHLATEADVQLTIYDINGAVVRRFSLGLKQAGYYTDRARAAYWDGRNEVGEPVASGVYFYQLEAGDYSQTRQMVILK